MASSEASIYLSTVEWGDEGYYLKEFARKFQLPRVAKIIKGQYRSLGVPTLPSPSLNQIVLVASAGIKIKVIAQCIKFKDLGRRAVPVGSKLSLPENYDGWFEILSEDGHSARCIESVAELAKSSRACLVRDPLKAHVSKSDDANIVSDKTRTLCAGEILNVEKLVSSDACKGWSRTNKFLKCVTSHGDTVYLPLELRGKFSSIAGEQNISGVHSVKNLMNKRFPFMVRLVHGKSPAGVKFVPEMRLLSFVEEESLVAMPLSKENAVVPLPQNAALKVLAPRNCDHLVNLREHEVLVNRCLSLGHSVSDCIQVCAVNSIKGKKHISPQLPQHIGNSRKQPPTLYSSVSLVECNTSDSPRLSRLHLQRELSVPAELPSHLSEDYRYDEIDRIYDYVRGFVPLPPNIKKECTPESSCDDDLKHVSLPQIGQILPSANNRSYFKPPDLPPEVVPSRRPFKATTRPIQPARNSNGTANLVNKTQRLKSKGVSAPTHRLKESFDEPVYEKIDHRRNSTKPVRTNETIKGLLRSYSTSKVPPQDNINANNLNEKALNHKKHPQFINQRPLPNPKQQRLCSSFNSQKSNGFSRVKPPADKRRLRSRKKSNCEEPQNVATSPLFHIRYKSLTDLLLDDSKTFPTPSNDSSGNSCNSNSASSEREELKCSIDSRSRWLSRPKSLSNLINNDSNGRRRLDNHNYYAVIQNDIIGVSNCDNSKFYTMPDSTRFTKNRYGSAARKKKFETMYL